MSRTRQGVCAAALTAVFIAAWISPQAAAQILPGPLVVRITSPTSGSSVKGTVPVTASAVGGSVAVAGVQFQLDGVDIGPEDTAAPFSVPWNSATASDGSHGLIAVARDVLGIRHTSDPVSVTVANNPAPPAAVRRYEENHASVSLSPGWISRSPNTGDWFAWSGGAAAESVVPNAQATFTFTGTSVTWIGYRSVDSGIARVYMDGVLVSEVDLFARRDESSARIFTVKGLSNASHRLTIEVSGLKNAESQSNIVIVDAFDVPAPVVSHLQDTDPDISYTAGWTGGDVSKPWSGGTATLSTAPGARATLTFNGTEVAWIGYRASDTGIARVFLDGSLVGDVDTYSSTLPRVQDTLFKATGLADANHTLTIEATGGKNAQSTGTLVLVDAFDVTTLGTRFQETDAAVVYSGDWTQDNLNRTWSEGTAAASAAPGARATFTFTGTSVSWIGCRKVTTGIGRVYLDGVFVAEIDTFAPPPIEGYQNTIYKATGLANGTHTLTIEATGQKNPGASSAYVVVDAFDVRR